MSKINQLKDVNESFRTIAKAERNTAIFGYVKGLVEFGIGNFIDTCFHAGRKSVFNEIAEVGETVVDTFEDK